MKNLKNFTLELSPKPFFDTEKETAEKVIENMFSQWDYMCRKAESISVLLFLADGSEILEFSGDLNQTFEWAYWLGVANNMPQPPNATEREKRNTHFYPKKYREDVSPRPYSWIKTLVDTIKRIGREKYDKDINVGYLYDNGPEFAISDFKFKRHREIARGNTMYPNSFVVCTAKLNEDKRKYAGFPKGIPQDTTIGTFLGRQFRKLAEAVGLDYLWLSNGMGFGTETWNICGALFDKKKFYPEKTEQAKKLMLDFWQDITKELKGIPIQTRGTNFSAGTEIATDAAPLSEIYENNWADAPVNSPWAALNYNVGLEISAWMSHIAKLPNDTLRYRFYINDPWFMNSPWLDRYEKQPWDIYLPMSVSRIDENGKTETANTINLLTADDSWGNMPEEISLDVTSHLRNAFTEAADDIGPLLWVYPFDEYSRIENPAEIFSEDMFIGEAIQSGLPLNTVINSLSFRKIIKDNPEKFMGSILIIPASFGETETLKNYTANGGKVIIYGSPKEDMATLLGLEKAKPIHGTGTVTVYGIKSDTFSDNSQVNTAYVYPQYNMGGLTEIQKKNAEILAEITIEKEKRVLCSYKDLGKGKIGFVQSLLNAGEKLWDDMHFHRSELSEAYQTQDLIRYLCQKFGLMLEFEFYDRNTVKPQVTIHRHNNSFIFSMHAQNNICTAKIRTELGCPIFTGRETFTDGKYSYISGEIFRRNECRLFIEQETSRVVSGNCLFQEWPEYSLYEKRLYKGLKNATVRYFPPKECKNIEFVVQPEPVSWFTLENPLYEYEKEDTVWGECYTLRNVTGCLYIMPLR